MNKVWYTLTSMLIILPGCLSLNKSSSSSTRTFFIQAPLDLNTVKELQSSMKSIVDTILQEELGATELIVSPQEKYAIFFPKKRQAITTYYVYDIFTNGDSLLFTALDNIKIAPPQHVSLESNLAFFGDSNSKIIDLVLFLRDLKKELLDLHQQVKAAAHSANEKYKLIHRVDLYDITKSEQFPYLPHLSIGHLRPRAIKALIKDPSKANEVLETIKECIIKDVSQLLVQTITPENGKVSFDTLGIYDAPKRNFIGYFGGRTV